MRPQHPEDTHATRAQLDLSAAPGDMPGPEFRAGMHRVADIVADYLDGVGQRPVVPPIQPGDVRRQLPSAAPEAPEPLAQILADYQRIIEPGTTHWNHPGFMAYFSVTGSGPGILGETLAAALNVNAMLWRTGPAPTELEELVCDWLRQAMGLPAAFHGHINDTASISSMLGLAAARHVGLRNHDIRNLGLAGRADLPTLTIYASNQAHSSIDKAVALLGLGLSNLRKVKCDEFFRMLPEDLERLIRADITADRKPVAVVATVGTTSTTSIDPVPEIAAICRRYNIWLHVDAAYAGVGAMCPELRAQMPGLELADSLVTNPHKWLFTPVDCSVLFVRDKDLFREAFSIVPDYLTTTEPGVTNLMDFGVQLGRRFRALKLWMVMRSFGLEGLRERMRFHCALAKEFESWVAADARFELAAPVPFTTVTFRARRVGPPEDQDRFNEALLARVNAAGPVFISHTKLNNRFTLRLCVGNLRTNRAHLETVWRLVRDEPARSG